MNKIDSIHKDALTKIEKEKANILRRKKLKEDRDNSIKNEVRRALNILAQTALQSLESGSDFTKFMFEKIAKDYYSNTGMFRIIISNLEVFDRTLSGDTENFRVYIEAESQSPTPDKVTDLTNFKVSCGYWKFVGGVLRVEAETLPSFELLRFIEDLNNMDKFVEACTRTNTP